GRTERSDHRAARGDHRTEQGDHRTTGSAAGAGSVPGLSRYPTPGNQFREAIEIRGKADLQRVSAGPSHMEAGAPFQGVRKQDRHPHPLSELSGARQGGAAAHGGVIFGNYARQFGTFAVAAEFSWTFTRRL